MSRFEQIGPNATATPVTYESTLRINKVVPRHVTDWYAWPTETGHVLLPQLPRKDDSCPSSGKI